MISEEPQAFPMVLYGQDLESLPTDVSMSQIVVNMDGIENLPTFHSRDRMAQAYLGLIGSPEVQEKCRQRLHWLAGQAIGQHVLDIGCSEGMLAILLGREGFDVTGVDINPEALAFGNELLGKEHEFIRNRIHLVYSDILTANLQRESYETVVLGEIIEHLTNPKVLIERACEYLKPQGRILITTPFGFFPHEDHRQTFVLSDMERLLSDCCNPEHLSVVDGYIRFVGVKETPEPKRWRNLRSEKLLELTEKVTVQQQQYLRGQIAAQGVQAHKLRSSIEDLKKKCDRANERIAEGENKFRQEQSRLQKEIEAQRDKLSELKGELAKSQELIVQLRRDFKDLADEKEKIQIVLYARNKDLGQKNKILTELTENNQSLLADVEKHHEALKKMHEESARQQEAIDALQKSLGLRGEELLQKNEELQHKDEELQHKDAELQNKDEVLQHKDEELRHKDEELQHKNEEIDHLMTDLQDSMRLLEETEKDLKIVQIENDNTRSKLVHQDQIIDAFSLELKQERLKNERLAQANTADQKEHLDRELVALGAQVRQAKEELAKSREKNEQSLALRRSLEQDLNQKTRTLARLKQQQRQLDTAFNALTRQEYLERIRNGEIEKTLSYRLGIALTQAAGRPGKNTFLLLGRLGAIAGQGLAKVLGSGNPTVATLPVGLPGGEEQALAFMAAKKAPLLFKDDRFEFSIPAGQSVLLITKESDKITEPPRAVQLKLQPEKEYIVSAECHLNGGEARFHIIEHGQKNCLQGQDYPLHTGHFRTQWLTHEEHNSLCLAVELRGKGTLKVSGLSIGFADKSSDSHKIILNSAQKDDDFITLTRQPQWQRISVTPQTPLAIWGRVRLEAKSPVKNTDVLARIEFLGKDGVPLKGPFKKIHHSKIVGDYIYIRSSAAGDGLAKLFELSPPAHAYQVRLGIQLWKAPHTIQLSNALELRQLDKVTPIVTVEAQKPKSTVSDRAAELKRECATLGWIDQDVKENQDPAKPTILAVMDEFTSGCFRPECNLIQPRPDNWEYLAEYYQPEVMFIESAWQGNGRTWQYRIGKYTNKPGNELEAMAAYCQEKNIPLVFWNKEDPVHHDKFMDAAQQAHTIFTTDARMIPSYREKTGNQNVFALPFAAQPGLHRPSPLAGRRDRCCFAGSCYVGRHPERGEAMEILLRAAKSLGLDIYDRNFGSDVFPFPEEYQKCVIGSLPYDKLCAEYSKYRVFLNVNSVIDSPTMFSRRVFELLACGTPIVSSYAYGIENILGTDAVWMVRDEKEAREAIDVLLHDDAEWRRRSLSGIRTVFSAHTYANRLAEVYEKIGLSLPKGLEPKVLLIAHADGISQYESLAKFYDQQSWRNFELTVLTNDAEAASRVLPSSVHIIRTMERKGDWLAEQLRNGSYDLLGFVNPQATYGPGYLQDLVNASRYASAGILGKALNGREFLYDEKLDAAGCLIRVPELIKTALPAGDALLGDLPLGMRTYCADADEFSVPLA